MKKNKKVLFLTTICMLFFSMTFGQNTILDVTYNGDYISAQGWAAWTKFTKSSTFPSGFGVITQDADAANTVLWTPGGEMWLGGEMDMNNDFWFTYTASNLIPGASYKIEADITMDGNRTCINLDAWTAGNVPGANTVGANRLTPVGTVYSRTITATTSTMTFGIGTGASVNPPHYARNILKSWKITETTPDGHSMIVYHNVNGATNSNPALYEDSDGLSTLQDLTGGRNGFEFAGWYTNLECTQAVSNPAIAPGSTGLKNFYAKWNVIGGGAAYTVTFKNENTTIATEYAILTNGYKVSLPAAPQKEGYVFKCWNIKQAGNGSNFTDQTVVSNDITVYAQFNELVDAIPIAVNLNMKHSVDGVSDFGRERHITSHTTTGEGDWNGHEEMMDYFFNELDVQCGRDNGSSNWKSKETTEDPLKQNWPDINSLRTLGEGWKNWYESDAFALSRQYEEHSKSMIMGLIPHAVYPSLDWNPATGFNKGGWQTHDVDAAAYFIAHYLDNNFAKTPSDIGEPLPKYWECMNEPDMAVMNPYSAMFFTSFEKLYEFHNLCADEIRNVLGEYAPQIGGFTWGQHDLFAGDMIQRHEHADIVYYQNSDASWYPIYDEMWLGTDGQGTRTDGSTLYKKNNRNKDWWQWDALFQEFMEVCGAKMDFYSVHFYDWPDNNDGGVIRSGGNVEASLDMIESFDVDRFGTRKDIVLSEFGSVNNAFICPLGYKRRDWEHLRPFNQMFMQFLDRPSHVVLTMPFAPIKATWGDYRDGSGTLIERYSATMMDPVGNGYNNTTNPNAHPDWEWSDLILWYELWKDVDGVRIDTKSADRDIQVDAYVDGNHVYLILNNLEITEDYLGLNMFDAYDNQVKSVKMTHQYLDVAKNRPVNDIKIMSALPAQVKIGKSATMILDIEYVNAVTIDEESIEKKYVSECIGGNTKNFLGRQKYYVDDLNGTLTTNINNVTVPTTGEATIRVGMRLSNGVRANIKLNDKSVLTMTAQAPELDVRGRQEQRGGLGYFCVAEVDVPVSDLRANNKIEVSIPHTSADITSVQLQVWDMTTEPGRFDADDAVLPTALTLDGDDELMNGKSMALTASFTPANTTNKALNWDSSDPSIISVDEFGVTTANATSGSAVITATSLADANITATKTITAKPFATVAVTGVTIEEGSVLVVEQNLNTQLTAKVLPINADNQTVVWTSSNDDNVSVLSNGKVIGRVVGETETITATVTDGGQTYTASINITVTVMGGEGITNNLLPEEIRPYPEASLPVIVRALGERKVTIEISKNSTVIARGDTTATFTDRTQIYVPYTITETPNIGTDYDVTFKLFDGDTEIDSKTESVRMIDHIRAESVTIANSVRSVKTGETIQLSADVLPVDTYNKKVSWESLNSSVATVNTQTGLVTGVSAGTANIKVTSNDGNFTDQVEITVQNETVVVNIENITIPASLTMFPETENTIAYTLVPSWTTQTDLEWSSSDDAIIAIDNNGKLTAGANTGTATITVKSKDNNSVSATCNVIISEIITVEAEDFDATGGDYEGFIINDGGTGINYNQSGDWADYEVYFPKTANYVTKYYIGAPDGSANISVQLYVDGTLAHTTPLTETGGWDTYQPFTSNGSYNITEGWHTIRIKSAGASEWQWNAIHYEFTASDITVSNIENGNNSNVSIYPNPAISNVYIQGGEFTEIRIFSLTGSLVLAEDLTSNMVNCSSLQNGIYAVELITKDGFIVTQKLIIQR